jgi:hypothetical protein
MSEKAEKPFLERVHLQAGPLLVVFCICLVALNWGRIEEGWGPEAFRIWLTLPIMQTTLFDFTWVLGILTLFIHQDAKRHGLSYWWILPTYPFMPTIGLLAYVIVRNRKLRAQGKDAPPLGAEVAA